jgi:hypothetical protein
MALVHSREDALQLVRTMPDGMFVDGLLLDCPKRRRREQAMNTRPMVIKWAPEHKKRFAKQYNRFVEICTKDLGCEILLKLLEQVTDEELKSWVEP